MQFKSLLVLAFAGLAMAAPATKSGGDTFFSKAQQDAVEKARASGSACKGSARDKVFACNDASGASFIIQSDGNIVG